MLVEFAAADKAGALSGQAALSEELEAIVSEVAHTGAVNGYPWDALRHLLARKLERVLGEFWRDVQDVAVPEGQSFEQCSVEPLTRSLLETRREGAPFTSQRLCELLVEPRRVYKSTRRYLHAVQRAVLVTSTEELLAPQQGTANQSLPESATDVAAAPPHGCGAPAPGSPGGSTPAAPAGTGSPGSPSGGAAGAGRKRKLPPELANGVVAE